MSDDLIPILACCILGLMSHGARSQRWIEWVIRVTIGIFLFGEIINVASVPDPSMIAAWNYWIMVIATLLSGALLFKPARQLISYVLTFVEQIVAGRVFLAMLGKLSVPVPALVAATNSAVAISHTNEPSAKSSRDDLDSGSEELSDADKTSGESADPGTDPSTDPITDPRTDPSTDQSTDRAGHQTAAGAESQSGAPVSEPPVNAYLEGPQLSAVTRKVSVAQSFLAERVFVPSSIPHMNGLWIYVTCLAFLLGHTELSGVQMPSIPISLPVSLDQLFSYNFLGLVFLSVCGVGIFVSRKPMEVLRRLGIVKPTLVHVMIGIAGIAVTFGYDYLWSIFTHGQEGLGYADKLSHYNEGAITPSASPAAATQIATATGICAGFGEEILSRGALQPVLGILPAAFLHGVLHGQFAHAPILILQVAGWSTIMGIIRRYTNTTTTIITHVGWNFLSTFLIAFNP